MILLCYTYKKIKIYINYRAANRLKYFYIYKKINITTPDYYPDYSIELYTFFIKCYTFVWIMLPLYGSEILQAKSNNKLV